MSAINFPAETAKLHESDRSFEMKLKPIYHRNADHWNAIGARGGVVLSSLSDEAAAAVAEVERRRDAARKDLAAPVRKAGTLEGKRLKAEAIAAARAYLEAYRALAVNEHNLNTYLSAAGQPTELPVTGHYSEDPREFLARVERATAAALPRRVLPPLGRQNFSDLVNGPTVAVLAAASSPIEH